MQDNPTFLSIEADLGIGPMSSEVIEAVFRYSHYYRKQLMLIASKNQIDYKGGYVNNWTTQQLSEYVSKLRHLYNYSNVKICRDHCGPGFNGSQDLSDTYETIRNDIANGFDLIHFDFCHYEGPLDKRLEETKKAIEFALNLNPKLLLEIGTDENMGTGYGPMNLSEIEKEMEYFKSFCSPQFYVVQTGSLIKEINQIGSFNKDFVSQVSTIARSKGMRIKEHNADYLDKESVALRKNLVGAMNIAPQFGVVQTVLTLNKCLSYGVDPSVFVDFCYESNKWSKWLSRNTKENKMLCSIIAGHYNFSSESYKEIIRRLGEKEDIREYLIGNLMNIIDHYEGK